MFYTKSINIFERLRDIYKKLGDEYRYKAYENAIKYLIKGDINKLGKKLSEKIKIIEEKGELNELNNLEKYSKIIDVKGFGPSFILKLIDLNLKIDNPSDLLNDNIRRELIKNGINLTHLQLVNLKYYKQLEKKINRQKVSVITNNLKKYLSGKNINIKKFQITGSYRREKEEIGDIDIILISEGTNLSDSAYLMSKVYNAIILYRDYIAKLVKGDTKFSFLLKYKNDIIQIDIRIFLEKSYYTALFYFTGSSIFNKQVRLYAKNKGYIINEYELKKIGGNPIKINSEKDIFDKLGIKYIEPKKRSFLNLDSKKYSIEFST